MLKTRVWSVARPIATSLAMIGVTLRKIGHRLVHRHFIRRRRDRDLGDDLRALQFGIQGLFELAHRGEILVQPRPVAGADIFQQPLAVIGHHRQHALLQHDFRIGLPVALGRILEARAEQARIKAERAKFPAD